MVTVQKCCFVFIIVTLQLFYVVLNLMFFYDKRYFSESSIKHPPLPNYRWRKSGATTDEHKFTSSLFISSPLLIDIANCKIPNIDPNKAIETGVVGPNRNISCINDAYRPITYKQGDFLRIDYSEAKEAEVDSEQLRCCYRAVGRDISAKYHDDINTYGDVCHFFKDKVKIKEEFIIVECYEDQSLIHVDFYSFFTHKIKNSTKKNRIHHNFDQYNILVVGIDSVSRLNFHRKMKKTKKFVKDVMHSIEMEGYSSIGDNTMFNVGPMTTGRSAEHIKSRCFDGNGTWKESCQFIWDHYSKLGYKTMYAEDSPEIATFNYLTKGFYKQPVDYYFRPLIMAAEDEIGHEENQNTYMCIGPRTQTEFLLEYVQEAVQKVTENKEKIFTLSWSNSLTHDDIELAGNADQYYYEFFKKLKQLKILDNSVIIFLSDHGVRWGKIVKTAEGKLEERLPFCFLYFPESFRQKYPKIIENVSRNSKKLTTAFDIYSTLMNLAKFRGKPEDSAKWFRHKRFKIRSKSLLGNIPSSRSCADCAIHPLWCPCNKKETVIDKNSTTVQMLAKHVVEEIHFLLNATADNDTGIFDKCAKLKLDQITNAWLIPNMDSSIGSEMSQRWQHYVIEIKTTPGGGLFESAIKTDGRESEVIEINRNNLYGDQSHCVKDRLLKLFCFCNKQL